MTAGRATTASDLLVSDAELRAVTHLKQPAAQTRFLERMRVPYRRRADGSLLVGRAAMERSDEAWLKTQPGDATGLKWSTSV